MPAFYVLILYISGLFFGYKLVPSLATQLLIAGIILFLLYDSIKTRPSLLRAVIMIGIFAAGMIRSAYPAFTPIPIEWYAKAAIFIEPFKARLVDGLKTGLDGSQRELIGGIILGRGSGEMNFKHWTHFIKSGMSHLLVASGAQVSLCVFPVIALAENVPFSQSIKKLLFVFAAILLAVLLLIVGLEPSILRAITACYLYLLARLINRRARALNIIYATALFWLWIDPSLVRNRGFQLSYAASWGLIYIYPRLRTIFQIAKPARQSSRVKKNIFKIATALREILLLTFCAQIVVAPVLAFNFHRFSPSGFIANLIAIPISEILIYNGLATSLIAQISTIPALWMSSLNRILLAILDSTAHHFSKFPYVRCPFTSIVGLFIPYFLAALYFEARFRPHGLINALHLAQNIVYPLNNLWRTGRSRMRLVLLQKK